MKNLITVLLLIASISLSAQSEPQDKNYCNNKLEICFLADATGSMRFAMEDLKLNIGRVLKDLKQNWQGWELEVGAVFFRDKEEEYLTRQFDKTTDLKAFELFIKNQYAVGGGDENEILPIALKQAIEQFDWSNDLNPKLILLLTDDLTGEAEKAAKENLNSKGISLVSVKYRNENIAFCGNSTGAEIEETLRKINSENPVAEDFSYLLSEKINDFIFSKKCVFERTENELSEKEIAVFPNPATDKFTVELPEGEWEVELQTIGSKTIKKRQMKKSGDWLVNHLAGGTYLLKISNGETTQTERLIIVRK